MNRRPLVSLFILFAVIMSADFEVQAGTSRTVGLGGDADYFTDSANVSRWYSSLLGYPNQVEFELGDVVHGMDSALSNQGLLGHGGSVSFLPAEDGRYGTAAFSVQDHLKIGPSDGAFSAYWARNFGPFQVGLGGAFSTYGVSLVGPVIGDRVDSQYFHQYGVGLGYNISSVMRIEFSGDIVNSMTASAGSTYNLPITDDWGTYGLRLRSFINVSDKLTLVPLVDFFCDVRTGLDLAGDRPVDIDTRILKIGAGANLQASSEMLLVFSGEYRQGRNNQSWQPYNVGSVLWDLGESEFYQIRLRSGLESKLLPWLKVRASVKYVRAHDEIILSDIGTSVRDESYVSEYVKTPVSLGIGLKFGGMVADLSYNDTPPLVEMDPSLTDLWTGNGDGYSAVTLTWKF